MWYPGSPFAQKRPICQGFSISRHLGIDLGGTKIAVALGDERGRLESHRRQPTQPSGDPQRDVARIVETARSLLAEAGVAASELAGVGVSAPGPLDSERGVLLRPPNLPGWDEVDLRTPLEAAFAAPVRIENDANAAALAEWRFGAGRGFDDVVYLTMSTGVGAGLILGGRLHRGVASTAGEAGHMPISEDGPACSCGLHGCLEAYVGGAAWTRRLQRETPADSGVAARAGGAAHARPEHVVAAAEEGDPFALAEMERWNTHLARGLAILSFVLAPQVFVLGTIAAAAGEELCLAPLREMLRARVWPQLRDVEIRAAGLGDRIGELSGLCVSLQEAEPEA